MGKWLAAGGAAIVIVLLVLWRQIDSSSEATAAPKPAAAPAPAPAYDALAEAKKVAKAEHEKAGVAEPAPAPAEPGKPQKIDVQSDEFFYKFQDVTPAILSRNAAPCYDGRPEDKRVSMNAKLTLEFHIKIKDGEVTVSNVHATADTLGDAALATCFTQAIQRSTWHDDSLPDWDADDQLLIRPERGFKKYLKSNIEYVGAEAPPQDNSVIRMNGN